MLDEETALEEDEAVILGSVAVAVVIGNALHEEEEVFEDTEAEEGASKKPDAAHEEHSGVAFASGRMPARSRASATKGALSRRIIMCVLVLYCILDKTVLEKAMGVLCL